MSDGMGASPTPDDENGRILIADRMGSLPTKHNVHALLLVALLDALVFAARDECRRSSLLRSTTSSAVGPHSGGIHCVLGALCCFRLGPLSGPKAFIMVPATGRLG